MSENKASPKDYLDLKYFYKRANTFLSSWKSSAVKNSSEDLFQGANAILVVVGNLDEYSPYHKSTAIQQWLFGNDFPDMLILFTLEAIHIVTNSSLALRLQPLKKDDKQHIAVEIYECSNTAGPDKRDFDKIIDIIRSSKEKRVGVLPKDTFSGDFVECWQAAFEAHNEYFELVDVRGAISAVMAVKDDDELSTIRLASKVNSILMKQFFDILLTYIDDEKNVTHEELAQEVESTMITRETQQDPVAAKVLQSIDMERIDWCYTPIIQSGGMYDLKPSAISDGNKLRPGTILCSLGVHYKGYCSNIGRTIFIDPNKSQEANYKFLLEVQRKVLDTIKHGIKICDVYNKAMSEIHAKHSELEKNFVKSIGFGMGLEFRDNQYTLNAKNTKELKSGMVLNVSVGFHDLENPKAKDEKSKTHSYALLVVDTVIVTNNMPEILTDYSKTFHDMSYFFGEDEEEEKAVKPDKPQQKSSPVKKATRHTAVLQTKFRVAAKEGELREQRRREHQKELAAQKLAEGLARFANGANAQTNRQHTVFRKFESYKRDTALSKEIRDLKISIDAKNDTIVLPIFGFAVPFHVLTLKSVTKTEEGDYTYLRLNFLTPGQASGKKEDMPFDDPGANFVRALTYRSTDPYLQEIYRKVLDLKKSAIKKEAEQKEKASIVEQDKLVEIKGRRPQRLGDVLARPGLDAKRASGDLEIHQNGLRYIQNRTGLKIDILFSNIRHLFFQPCDNELYVILHAHLRNPVLVGKKKTQDVQFYREASEVQFDDTVNRKRKFRYGDEDELGAEQEERRRRALLNNEFKHFAEKIIEASENHVDVAIPSRDFAFNGVPFRSSVLLWPAGDCLVHLTDLPFLVVTMEDVEIAHLERVQFGLKNFDIVFIFKDYAHQPVHISNVPAEDLEQVKEWLDERNIPITEGAYNLNWTHIMKTINEDPAHFFEEGGWNFLQPGTDGDGSEASSDSASEFVLTESEEETSLSEESSYEDEVSESSEATESDESGPEWEELEDKARQSDEKHTTSGLKRKDSREDGRASQKKQRQ